MAKKPQLASIEYVGSPGITVPCVNAIQRLLQFGDEVSQAKILSFSNGHCFLLNVNLGELIAVKSGFGSGYPGEGPRGFSYILSLLEFHGTDIDEFSVDEALFNRVDESAMLQSDIDWLEKAMPLRPRRWYDYIVEDDWDQKKSGHLWRRFPDILPFALIDYRIADLALTFWEDPDARLLAAYRRLEDFLRQRIGSDEHGANLFSDAFQGANPPLIWREADKNEQSARAGLFISTYRARRNPRAHKESIKDKAECLDEFLLLNHLYRLENAACNSS